MQRSCRRAVDLDSLHKWQHRGSLRVTVAICHGPDRAKPRAKKLRFAPFRVACPKSVRSVGASERTLGAIGQQGSEVAETRARAAQQDRRHHAERQPKADSAADRLDGSMLDHSRHRSSLPANATDEIASAAAWIHRRRCPLNVRPNVGSDRSKWSCRARPRAELGACSELRGRLESPRKGPPRDASRAGNERSP